MSDLRARAEIIRKMAEKEIARHTGQSEIDKTAGLADWFRSKSVPTQAVLALATLLATAQGVASLKSQVAEELQNRGQQPPAALMEPHGTMTIESPPGMPPVIDETEPQAQPKQQSQPQSEQQYPWLNGARQRDPIRRT